MTSIELISNERQIYEKMREWNTISIDPRTPDVRMSPTLFATSSHNTRNRVCTINQLPQSFVRISHNSFLHPIQLLSALCVQCTLNSLNHIRLSAYNQRTKRFTSIQTSRLQNRERDRVLVRVFACSHIMWVCCWLLDFVRVRTELENKFKYRKTFCVLMALYSKQSDTRYTHETGHSIVQTAHILTYTRKCLWTCFESGRVSVCVYVYCVRNTLSIQIPSILFLLRIGSRWPSCCVSSFLFLCSTAETVLRLFTWSLSREHDKIPYKHTFTHTCASCRQCVCVYVRLTELIHTASLLRYIYHLFLFSEHFFKDGRINIDKIKVACRLWTIDFKGL